MRTVSASGMPDSEAQVVMSFVPEGFWNRIMGKGVEVCRMKGREDGPEAGALSGATNVDRRGINRRGGYIASIWGRVGVSGRVAYFLFGLVLAPMALVVFLLEAGAVHDSTHLMAVWLAVALGLLIPVSRAGGELVIARDLRALNDFCSEMQRGGYGARFVVDVEGDDEHELLRLKRNMNWMAHHIETQTRWLHARLDESASRTRRFEEMSFRDGLTGLYNRRFFDRILPDLCRDFPRRGFCLVLIDCDSFKQVNDRHGHLVGDKVLNLLGTVVIESVRDGIDYPFRFGGDEFGVVFRDLEVSACLTACERIRCRFAEGAMHGCTVSIGLAECTRRLMSDSAVLLGACDAALYRAKSLGGNRVVVAGKFLLADGGVDSGLCSSNVLRTL